MVIHHSLHSTFYTVCVKPNTYQNFSHTFIILSHLLKKARYDSYCFTTKLSNLSDNPRYLSNQWDNQNEGIEALDTTILKK